MFKPLNRYIKVLKTPKNGSFPYCNCIFIDDQARVMIDASCGQALVEKLHEEGLDVLLLTHFHMDHTLHAAKLGADQIWCHESEIAANESIKVYLETCGFHYFGAEWLGRRLVEDYQLEPKQVHRSLSDGEILDFGHVRLKVIHTPGHTTGHISFFEEESGILFIGDVDPWYGNLCSDLNEYLNTINKCLELRPRVVIPGHHGILEGDLTVKLLAYRDRILRREEKLIQSLAVPQTLEELAAKHSFLKSNLDEGGPYQRFFNTHGILNHLNRLIKMGRVKKDDNLYFLDQ